MRRQCDFQRFSASIMRDRILIKQSLIFVNNKKKNIIMYAWIQIIHSVSQMSPLKYQTFHSVSIYSLDLWDFDNEMQTREMMKMG